ncbi:MAG: phosphoserine phosphatase SerB [Pseudomonadota bacterium]
MPSALIATLIANPANPCLGAELADKCRDAVGASAVYWLADGIAADLPLPPDVDQPAKWLSMALADEEVDFVIQSTEGRRKKALIADMDSTMIQQECIDELADVAGVGDAVKGITARAMRGELEYEPALRERIALLKGQPKALIQDVIASRLALTPGGKALVATMKAHGAWCALVSGGFTDFTQPIAAMLGFDENRANTFAFDGDEFAGTVIPPILGRASKAQAMDEMAQTHGLEASDFIAVGDGANDLDMLVKTPSGVALHAKPIVAETAPMRIDHGDLTALLYIQGYRKTDFVGV